MKRLAFCARTTSWDTSPWKNTRERLQSHRMRAAALLQQQDRLEAWNQRLEEEILALRTVPNAPGRGRAVSRVRTSGGRRHQALPPLR